MFRKPGIQFQLKRILFSFAVLIFIFSFPNPVTAQDDSLRLSRKELRKATSYLTDTRKWTLDIPIWVPGFAGDFTYGDISIEGEDGADPGIPENPIEPPEPGEPPIGGGNILSRLFTSSTYLKFFFMNKISYSPGRHVFSYDAFAGAIGNNVDFAFNGKKVASANFRSLLLRFYAGYKIIDEFSKNNKTRGQLIGYLGGRFHLFHLETSLRSENLGFEIDPFWGEAILGLYGKFMLKKWLFSLQADMGGFTNPSKNSFMLNANVSYRSGRLISFKLGWTDWRIRYTGRWKGEPLYLKTHLSGPNAGITFNF